MPWKKLCKIQLYLFEGRKKNLILFMFLLIKKMSRSVLENFFVIFLRHISLWQYKQISNRQSKIKIRWRKTNKFIKHSYANIKSDSRT